MKARKRSNFGEDKDERLRARPQRRNLAWLLGPKAPAPLADTTLRLPQLSLLHAQPAALLVCRGTDDTLFPGNQNSIRASSEGDPFQPPLLEQPYLATARQGASCCLPPRSTKTPLVCLSSTAVGSTGDVTHDENRCYSSGAGA